MNLKTKFLYGEEANLPAEISNGKLYFLVDKGRIYFDINNQRIKLYDADFKAATKAGTDAQADVDALEAIVGTPDTGKTIVQMIRALEAEMSDEPSEEEGEPKTLGQRVAEAEAAITTLNADNQTAGSVKKIVADAIAAIVAGADEDFDTLKEIADWIANDTTGAAKMSADIATLKGADTVEGSVAKTVKDAIGALDVADTAVEGQYVESVSQVDGKIVVNRKSLPDFSGLEWGTFSSSDSE